MVLDSVSRALRRPEPLQIVRRTIQEVVQTLQADLVDVFLADDAGAQLVSVARSATALASRAHAAGLDRVALDRPGRLALVWRQGGVFLSERADLDTLESRALTRQLGVRSVMLAPLEVGDRRVGVLAAYACRPACFTPADLASLTRTSRDLSPVIAELRPLASEDAVAFADRATSPTIDALTPRQREVAQLIARGYSNAQIARELVLVPGTVANHIEQMLTRLQFRNRAQIAAWISTQPSVALTAERATRRHHETVLIVEDDSCLREVLIEIVEDEGYAAVAAADGHEAVQLAQAALPDAALVDLELPDGSGLEILRLLEASDTTRPIPVFVVSGHSEPVWDGRTPRPRGFVSKPFDLTLLLGALETAIGHHPACQTLPTDGAP
jgi:DNA-binding NarL/FixJ family response regulator